MQQFLLRDVGYIQYKEVSRKFSFELNYACKNNFKLLYEIATQKKTTTKLSVMSTYLSIKLS